MHFEQYSFDNSSLARKQEKVAFSPDLFISHTSLSDALYYHTLQQGGSIVVYLLARFGRNAISWKPI